ncbi:MAG: hypothetical protein ACLUNO_14035 [Oscillospiraceae bacterium]
MGYENFIELGYCRMERMCYDVQAVQTFRENIVRDIVPVVSAAAAGKREASRHRHVPPLRQRGLRPRRRSDALRQGRRCSPLRRRCTTPWAMCRARFSA